MSNQTCYLTTENKSVAIAAALRLGRTLRDRRKLLGITQEEMERISGYCRGVISRVETGARPNMDVRILIDLLQAAGLRLKVVPKGSICR